MIGHDQSRLAGRGSTADSRRGGVRQTLILLTVLASMLCTSGFWAAGNANADSGVDLSVVVTGSDKDGFDLIAENQDDKAYKCKATVTVTKDDGTQTTYDYSGTVRKKEKRSLGGEAGLKPAPISARVSASSCLPVPDPD